MDRLPWMFADLAQVVDLRMAVVTRGNAVVRFGFENLLSFQPSVLSAFIRISGLQESTAVPRTIWTIRWLLSFFVDKNLQKNDEYCYDPGARKFHLR